MSRLVNSLWKDPKQKKSFISTKKEAKEAILKYEVISAGERYSLLEIILETGRHHQIRCQLSAIGHPIKGDLKYGAKRSNKNGSISLHAQKISFKHPVKSNSITLTAPPPNESLWIQLSEKIEKDNFHQ
jgi:23S rRNA pseudouridine1911/1915/1917 synthase